MMYYDREAGLKYSLDGLLEKLESHGYTEREYCKLMGYKTNRIHAWAVNRWAMHLPYLCDAAGLFECRLGELIKFDFENEYTMCNAEWEPNSGCDISYEPLRKLLLDKGISVRNFLIEAGVESGSDFNWAKTGCINHDRDMPLRDVYHICKHLNCSIDCVMMNMEA